MGYTEKVLTPGEIVKYIARLHWWVYVRSLFLLAIGIWLLKLGLSAPTGDQAGGLEGFSGLFLLFFGIVAAAIVWLRRRSTELIVTNRKVIGKWGLVSRHSVEQQLEKIDSVQISQGLLGRALDYGSIFIHGSGTTTTPITTIAKPLEFRRQVQMAVEARKLVGAE
jgi:uncharacterized membrane protein YdbT with pleckstrin-like domain